MNEIKRCSLSGVGFMLEKDAYERLSDYLKSLRIAYKNNPDSDEILADIEARIAELILSAQSSVENVVCLPLIENIIEQLGSPEAISGEEECSKEKSGARIPRRLYRDLENAKLGGVCAGLAKHFGIDAVWVRVAIFSPLVLLFMSNIPYMWWCGPLGGNIFGIFLILYLILWFAIPAAKSARQKLEQEGERISVQSIADRQGATSEEKAQSSVANFVSTLGRVAVVLLKLFVGIILLPLVVVAFLLAFLVGATISGLYVDRIAFNIGNFDTLAQAIGEHGVGLVVLALIFILIPILYLIHLFIALLLNKRPRWWVLGLTILAWIINLVCLAIAGISYAEVSAEDEVVRILKYDNSNSESRRVQEALDAPMSEEEKLQWEQLVNAPDAKSID